MTTNIAECINGVLLFERDLPITTFIDLVSDTYFTVYDGGKNGLVNFKAQTCTCKKIQLDQLPCAHAMLAIRKISADMYAYYSDYYLTKRWKCTYAGVVSPLPHQTEWMLPNEVSDTSVLLYGLPVIAIKKTQDTFCWGDCTTPQM
ncbi:hypothetical protein UlMin_013198 [Ulmus minor]